MVEPLVSVVVPSYNQAHYLEAALDSVIFQDYPNIEIIICNHGSTDNTSEVIASFCENVGKNKVSFLKHMDYSEEGRFVREYVPRYPQNRRIVVLESKENIGGTRSYNEGFMRANGKYCTYLVGDDRFQLNGVRRMVEVLERENCDFVYSDMVIVDDKDRILQKLSKPDYSFESCFADWFHLGVSKLYKTTLHQVSGFYDPEYRNANDYDMYLRFALDGCRFVHIPEVLYYLRSHDPNNKNEPASWRGDGYRNLIRESSLCASRAREAVRTGRAK
jgi:glycosyltransferase involved in cell wall biosynthesis